MNPTPQEIQDAISEIDWQGSTSDQYLYKHGATIIYALTQALTAQPDTQAAAQSAEGEIVPDGAVDLISMLCRSYDETCDIIRKADIDLYCKIPLFQGTRNTMAISALGKMKPDTAKASAALIELGRRQLAAQRGGVK